MKKVFDFMDHNLEERIQNTILKASIRQFFEYPYASVVLNTPLQNTLEIQEDALRHILQKTLYTPTRSVLYQVNQAYHALGSDRQKIPTISLSGDSLPLHHVLDPVDLKGKERSLNQREHQYFHFVEYSFKHTVQHVLILLFQKGYVQQVLHNIHEMITKLFSYDKHLTTMEQDIIARLLNVHIMQSLGRTLSSSTLKSDVPWEWQEDMLMEKIVEELKSPDMIYGTLEAEHTRVAAFSKMHE